MDYRKANVISIVMTILGVSVAFIIPRESSETFRLVAFIIIAAIIISGFIIRIVFCRCPSCRKVLYYHHYSFPNYCPRCGEPL